MPPFSACSMCNRRTRKMVKDPDTLKLIYVCPDCYVNRFPYKYLLRAAQKMVKQQETERKEEEMRPANSCNPPIPKVTPPLMQTVIIKDRKYVAISETADDE
ncbi:uncharacterized protein LOC120451900 [Drosophila santomea]|uniref:uncharacterized protein LOC120451900 n=1 Tax=Drosophila santomea TaxID=129105 RepID=UPI0019549283|nr:uncharacterized protein LOC120451900 [Drosophila santomea]